MIETRGLIGAIEAGDAGTKAAAVEFLGKEYADAGICRRAFRAPDREGVTRVMDRAKLTAYQAS